MLDLSAQRLHVGGYTEAGAAGANLIAKKSNRWFLSAAPALEIGGEFDGSSGTLWRPYLRAGGRVFDQGDMAFGFRFASFDIGTTVNEVLFEKYFAEVEVGLHLLSTNGLNLKLSYEGRFGENTRSQGGHLKLSVKF